MTESKKYQRYLGDLGQLVKEYALEAKEQAEGKTGEDRFFYMGIVFGYMNVINLMQHEARAFEIGLDELRLDDIDPERNLS